ncbi:hypothetical protein Acsp05_34670 [Actinokineospora sp. NBRC 105648]|nr:hypothetical protein Acsp05_34670 [Actinokineospora sp. NBRC 105648]
MPPPEYVIARSVLLDALEALGPHRAAVILVGAQAVYANTGDADLTTAPTTTNADLAVVPGLLPDDPRVPEVLRAAGFVPGSQPGIWLGRGQVAVDLLTPAAFSGPGKSRSVDLPPHGKFTRRTPGLEAAVFDNQTHSIIALDELDIRSFQLKVAGPAALVVAKMIKISERATQPSRLRPKDGLDVLRLLRTTDPANLAASLREIASQHMAEDAVVSAVAAIREHGREWGGLLPSLAAAAEAGSGDPDVIRASVVALVEEVLDELGSSI